MNEKHSKSMFAWTPFAAISYEIGDRQFVLTAAPVTTYVGIVGDRESWDPLTGAGTNRKEDKAHRQRIAQYVQDTENYVLNSVVIYAASEDAFFAPDDEDNAAVVKPGVLYLRPGARLKVGDGGHRTTAFGEVIKAHEHGDEVFERMQRNGQPMVIVLDDSPASRAQDFVDLQRNAKPLNASIAESMDRRRAFNRVLLDEVVKADTIPIFGGGKRVEFLVDTPGRLSDKIAGFKTVRYASGTLLVGTAHRSTASWNDAVEVQMKVDETAPDLLAEFWQAFSALPAVAAALVSSQGVIGLRQGTWLTSANLLYAIAAAVHKVTRQPDGSPTDVSITTAMEAMDDVDFARGAATFHGTLVEQGEGGKADRPLTGREAWEGAASVLAEHIADRLGILVAAATAA